MDLKKAVQVTEVVGGIGILISLIILIVEVRTNTDALNRQASLDRNARLFEPYISGIPEIYTKVKAVDGLEPIVSEFANTYDLQPADAVRWTALLQSNWQSYEIDFRYAGRTQELDAAVRYMMSFPDNQLYWSEMKPNYSSEFVQYVDSLDSQ